MKGDKTMTTLLRVLIVDDSDDDAKLMISKLRSEGYDPKWSRVDTSESMKRALEREEWDVILCDYKMPLFSVHAALKVVQEKNIDIPFILVSGAIGEDTAMAAVKSGAHDYVMKGNLCKLPVTIEKELSEAKIRRKKKKSDETPNKND
jgi:putative two-component system response regulator